jgi:hypothetical protein
VDVAAITTTVGVVVAVLGAFLAFGPLALLAAGLLIAGAGLFIVE